MVPGDRPPSSDVGTSKLDARRVYTGRILNLDIDRVRFPNGSVGELEMIRHPGASAVVPFLSDPAGEDSQLLLDYPLAFGTIGAAGFFRTKPLIGVVIAITCRFISHFVSGVIFSLAMGLFGGLLPAARAARLKIVNALREA